MNPGDLVIYTGPSKAGCDLLVHGKLYLRAYTELECGVRWLYVRDAFEGPDYPSGILGSARIADFTPAKTEFAALTSGTK
jgi:hypothetical protein